MPKYLQLPISGTTAIRPENIYTVLEVPPRANGYDLGYICCNEHGKTNMWARYKPEGIGGPAPITAAQRKANNYGLRPSGGLTRAYSTNMADINNLVEATWSYSPPSSTQWHRISDWDGYQVQAMSPTAAVREIDFPLNKSSIDINLTTAQINTDESLTLTDFDYCQDLYFCVVIWTESNTTGEQTFRNFVTAADKIGNTTSANRTKVTITRSDLQTLSSGNEIHYAVCFSTTCKTSLSSTLLSTSLYPIVSNTSTTDIIHMSTSAPFAFKVTGVSPKASILPTTDSLDKYGMFFESADGAIQINALGVGGYSGTVTFFGYFTTDSTTSLAVTGTPLRCTMRPTINGTVATVPPVLYIRNASGGYEQPSTTSVTISSSQPLYVALEFSNIAFIPREGAAWMQPSMNTYDKFFSSFFVCKYLAADTASTSATLFSQPVNVWQGAEDRTFTVDDAI